MYFRQKKKKKKKKKKKSTLLVIVMQQIYQQGVQNVCGCQWVYYMYICPHFMIPIPVLEGLSTDLLQRKWILTMANKNKCTCTL